MSVSQTESTTVNQKAKEVKTKERVQLDFTPEALQKLEEIQKAVGATTRAEVIRNAIRLYSWFITETTPNSKIKIFNEKDEITSAFKASLLHDAL